MGRKSLKESRTAMILDAFETCIGRFGIEGSSLERIAEVAGVKRSIIRHYIGNRDQLLLALANRVVARYQTQAAEMFASLPKENRDNALLWYLFPGSNATSAQELMVIESLIALSERRDDIRQIIKAWMEGYIEQMSQDLLEHHPHCSLEQCTRVAYGIIGIVFNHDSMAPLQMDDQFGQIARESARLLLNNLG